ncbi:ABC transporter ATP-binding protein (plasmid) [Clostridium tetani]|uniref:ABC transporter ATP-binding protein n=1 Tax=Clostridium tetani TaxID=1513 RepID=UPI00051395D2|nr:ABC transporter ATP-binding protein [Clostridium tetani]AVP55899.1 ABC transporter ATP-binding protein [Clostridium tetani]KGI41531.1 hypothetical protein KY55_13840 [Clostridium tetani]RXI49605.1 ABC transporter ATP-binding protein [Clostridium tetani]RXI57143.1 ABC transporter ATP-binding protein [Clostridium tetani]RXI67873.1 ABC transporter ATP-binding protein [Clostridium tetani]
MRKTIFNSFYMLKILFKYTPKYIIFTICNSIFSTIDSLLSVISIKIIIDTSTGQIPINKLVVFISIQIGFAVLFSVTNSYYMRIFSPKQIQNLKQRMHKDLFDKLLEIDISFYDDTEFFNKYIIAMQNTDQRALGVLDTIVLFFRSLLNITGLTILISTMDRPILISVIVVAFVNFLINTYMSQLAYKSNIESVYPNRKITYVNRVFYLKDYAQELRMTDISTPLYSYYDYSFKEVLQIIKKYGVKQCILQLMQYIVQIGYRFGVILYLAFKVLTKTISVGDFSALFSGANKLASDMGNILQSIPQLYQHGLFIEDYREFIEYKPDKMDKESSLYLNEYNEFKFNQVYYKYNDNEDNILSNINLSIKKGENIALVGLNGAGKTTLTKLILNLYKPTQGEILLNDIPYYMYNKESINNIIGAVFQDFEVFSLPIIENILMRKVNYNNKERDEEIVLKALEYIGLREKVESSPKGIYSYITRELDEEGLNFSGGELQKLAVARILANKYQILILDEPSSSLDAQSEADIFKTVLNAYKDKTIIMISHRLSNIKNADTIYFLHEGKILESGTHNELMELNGSYSKLYQLQANNYI